MNAKVLLLAVLSSGVFAVSAANAQRSPQNPPYDAWCRDMQMGHSGGSARICSAYTYEQCMASRTSHTETCYLNPLYDPSFADWRRRNPNY